jgi:hypothetical protein
MELTGSRLRQCQAAGMSRQIGAGPGGRLGISVASLALSPAL